MPGTSVSRHAPEPAKVCDYLSAQLLEHAEGVEKAVEEISIERRTKRNFSKNATAPNPDDAQHDLANLVISAWPEITVCEVEGAQQMLQFMLDALPAPIETPETKDTENEGGSMSADIITLPRRASGDPKPNLPLVLVAHANLKLLRMAQGALGNPRTRPQKEAFVMLRIATKELEAAIQAHCEEERYSLGQTFCLALGAESFEGINLRSISLALRTLADSLTPVEKEPA